VASHQVSLRLTYNVHTINRTNEKKTDSLFPTVERYEENREKFKTPYNYKETSLRLALSARIINRDMKRRLAKDSGIVCHKNNVPFLPSFAQHYDKGIY